MIKKYLLSPTLICKEWGSKAWFASQSYKGITLYMRLLLLLLLLLIYHTTSCISGHVSPGHQAISYSVRCLKKQAFWSKFKVLIVIYIIKFFSLLHYYYYYYYYYYYCYYYYYYYYSIQATSIIKRSLIGLACVARAGNYLITGRARGTREGERRPPLLFSPHASSTFLLSSPRPPSPPQKNGAYAAYDWPYSGTFIRVSKHGKRLSGTDQGRGR